MPRTASAGMHNRIEFVINERRFSVESGLQDISSNLGPKKLSRTVADPHSTCRKASLDRVRDL